uniref:Salivary secreted lipocalin n=1 Tax=Ornithodoros coriaceus TaxID=92741 RepID=B2D2B7_ORNCO|nr:salivary secreted lipocalin [Ornithodoros coriaceus]
MDLKFVVIVTCSLFGTSLAVMFDDTAGGYADVWKALSESDAFAVVKQNDTMPGLECESVRIKSKDIKNRRLDAVFAFRDPKAKQYKQNVLQMSTSKHGQVPFDNIVTMKSAKVFGELGKYELLYSKDGCLILRTPWWHPPNRMSFIHQRSSCEMWMVATKADKVTAACVGHYKTVCNDPLARALWGKHCVVPK